MLSTSLRPRMALCFLLVTTSLALGLGIVLSDLGRDPLLLPTAHANPPGPMSDVVFYQEEFEGESFVWVIDRSCSMAWGGNYDSAKAEVVYAINQLTPNHEFGIVLYNGGVQVLSSTALPATVDNLEAAENFILPTFATGYSCVQDALFNALEISETSAGSERVVFVVGNPPQCNPEEDLIRVVLNVTAENSGAVIHTFHYGSGGAGTQFFQSLATMNGGTYFGEPEGNGPDHNFFQRGDVNADGVVQPLSDATYLLAYGFLCGALPPCFDAADVDDNGFVEAITDTVFLLNSGFVPGSAQPPYPPPGTCGVDPYFFDGLNCNDYVGCP